MREHDTPDTVIFFFGISASMSSSCNNARLAGSELEHATLYVIDSMNLSTGIGLQIIKAAELAGTGMDAADIYSRITSIRGRVRSSFIIDTLTYLQRGGRCSGVTAIVANTLHIKPMISVTDGAMNVTRKFRGTKDGAIMKYVESLDEMLESADPGHVFITHSGCSEEVVRKVKEHLEAKQYFKEIHVTRAGGIVSCHCGPNTLGVLYYQIC